MNGPLDSDELIRCYPVLNLLPPRMLRILLDNCRPVQAAAGEVLFDTHMTIQSFLMLTQGTVRVISPGRERELLLYRVQPGGCCAVSICHLFGDTRCRVRAEAESDLRGVAVSQLFFCELVSLSPDFQNFIFQAFAGRFTELTELVERITSMRLDERLARMLASRGGLIQTTHSQLADDLGSVREVISRLLKDFEDRGLIRLERGQIEVLDPDALLRYASLGDSGH